MYVCLNSEGRRVWGQVFPDGKVPVCSSDFEEVNLGLCGVERVVLVSWSVLSAAQKEVLLSKISQMSKAPKEQILSNILRVGLPLRERYTTGFVAMELRYFI